MPTLTASRNAILAPMQTVSGIIARHSTLPILSNVLITQTGRLVSFTASNVEIQLTTDSTIDGDSENFGATLDARKAVDILRALPNDATVKLKFEQSKATLQSGRSRFTLQTLPAEDFPTIAAPTDISASLSITSKALHHLLRSVSFAAGVQDVRYYLNGVLLDIDGTAIRAVATDGHRMAVSETTIERVDKRQAILPAKTVAELLRLLDDASQDPVTIDLSEHQVRFRFGQVDIVSKIIEGKFPDYQRVIPRANKSNATCLRADLSSALDRAAIMTGEKFKGVRLSFSDGALKINASNAEQEEAAEEVEINYSGDAIEMGLNVSYLQDMLGIHKSAESVSVALHDGATSALITVSGDDAFRYVVMPMRI